MKWINTSLKPGTLLNTSTRANLLQDLCYLYECLVLKQVLLIYNLNKYSPVVDSPVVFSSHSVLNLLEATERISCCVSDQRIMFGFPKKSCHSFSLEYCFFFFKESGCFRITISWLWSQDMNTWQLMRGRERMFGWLIVLSEE